MNKVEFLEKYNLAEKFEKSGFDWKILESIFDDYSARFDTFEQHCSYIATHLRNAPNVHSVKYRAKHPEHLIEKLIRKGATESDAECPRWRTVTLTNYLDFVSDIMGLRALHLFKDDWAGIHDFIQTKWETKGPPVANIREGDAITEYSNRGCEIEKHPFGYRSVHYLITTKPFKTEYVAEIQVRTIFEEGWSEIDHRLRYPYDTDNAVLSQFLLIFNRLAGSADEMGSFTRFLGSWMKSNSEEQSKRILSFEEEIRKLKLSVKDEERLISRIGSIASIDLSSIDFSLLKFPIDYEMIKIDYSSEPWKSLASTPRDKSEVKINDEAP